MNQSCCCTGQNADVARDHQDVNERLVNLNAAVKYLSEDKSRSLEAKVSHVKHIASRDRLDLSAVLS